MMNDAERQEVREEIYRQMVVRPFHDLLYNSTQGAACNGWAGRQMLKMPVDLWTYMEIIADTKPEVIVETGAWCGGSAAFFADVMRMVGLPPDVVSVDLDERMTGTDGTGLPAASSPHPGVSFVGGDSVDATTIERVTEMVGGRRCMVSLDSDHSTGHVWRELTLYAPLVSPGCYLVVEDTNTPGPDAAVADFLGGLDGVRFAPDPYRERWAGLTFHPGGWLKAADVGIPVES